jgi:hypothetical protein
MPILLVSDVFVCLVLLDPIFAPFCALLRHKKLPSCGPILCGVSLTVTAVVVSHEPRHIYSTKVRRSALLLRGMP